MYGLFLYFDPTPCSKPPWEEWPTNEAMRLVSWENLFLDRIWYRGVPALTEYFTGRCTVATILKKHMKIHENPMKSFPSFFPIFSGQQIKTRFLYQKKRGLIMIIPIKLLFRWGCTPCSAVPWHRWALFACWSQLLEAQHVQGLLKRPAPEKCGIYIVREALGIWTWQFSTDISISTCLLCVYIYICRQYYIYYYVIIYIKYAAWREWMCIIRYRCA